MNHYYGVINVGCTCRKQGFLSTSRRASEKRQQGLDSGGDMWIWYKGVGKWNSVQKVEREMRVWVVWRRFGTW